MTDVPENHVERKIVFVNTWPLSVSAGSGAAFFAKGLYRQLEINGGKLKMISLDNTFKNYHLYLIKRIFFNFLLGLRTRFTNEIVLGFDFDGFCLSRKNNYFIALPRGIFADITQYEKGLYYLSLKVQAFFEKINLQRAHAIIVSSQYAKDRVVSLYKIEPDKVAIISNGFDLDSWEKYLSEQKVEKRSKKRILAVAKFYPRKKIEVLVKSFAILSRIKKDVELFLVGDGVEIKRLQKLVSELGVKNSVTFFGNISEREKMACIYKNSDIFCHPSVQENFSNVLLEAMASCKPIVAARAASMPEIVKDGVTGLLFNANDSEDLSQKLLDLLNNSLKSSKMGEEGYKLLINNYLWKDQIQKFFDFFETVVKNTWR